VTETVVAAGAAVGAATAWAAVSFFPRYVYKPNPTMTKNRVTNENALDHARFVLAN
jgi:hypothetical protein